MTYDLNWLSKSLESRLNNISLTIESLQNESEEEFINRVEFAYNGYLCEVLMYSNGRFDVFVYDDIKAETVINLTLLLEEQDLKENSIQNLIETVSAKRV